MRGAKKGLHEICRRWAKSTLVLVPLFGVHYTVFLGMSYSIGVNETVEVVWLFCDQLFASFQVHRLELFALSQF